MTQSTFMTLAIIILITIRLRGMQVDRKGSSKSGGNASLLTYLRDGAKLLMSQLIMTRYGAGGLFILVFVYTIWSVHYLRASIPDLDSNRLLLAASYGHMHLDLDYWTFLINDAGAHLLKRSALHLVIIMGIAWGIPNKRNEGIAFLKHRALSVREHPSVLFLLGIVGLAIFFMCEALWIQFNGTLAKISYGQALISLAFQVVVSGLAAWIFTSTWAYFEIIDGRPGHS